MRNKIYLKIPFIFTMLLFYILTMLPAWNNKVYADTVTKTTVSAMSYGNILGLISLEEQAGHIGVAIKYFEIISNKVLKKQDTNAAVLGGWLYFNHDNYKKALTWFQRATRWNPDNNDARYGTALCLYRLNKLEQAARIAQGLSNYPKAQKLLSGILVKKAVTSYKNKQYQQTIKILNRANNIRPIPDWAKEIEAWSYYHQGQYQNAASLFEQLYKRQHKVATAKGLFMSLVRLGSWNKLEDLAMHRGPIAEMWVNYRAKHAFNNSQFLIAKELDPTICSGLPALDGPYASTSFAFRHKSGDKGTSRLDITRFPIVRIHKVFGGVNQIELSIATIRLESGSSIHNGVPVGTDLDWTDVSRGFPHTLDFGIQPMIYFLHESQIDTFASFGLTPSHGPISPALIGNLGIKQKKSKYSWRIALFRNPVRQSILSYIGMKNPRVSNVYPDISWGRVTEKGIELGGSHKLFSHIGGWIYSSYSELDGVRVARNRHQQIALGAGYSYSSSIFQYFYIGPYIYWTRYQKNLNHFTLGHGGYFSPSHLINIGISTNFLTRECRNFQLKGKISLGYEQHREASSPWFPLMNPNSLTNAYYNGSSSNGLCGNIRLVGVYSVRPHWQIGSAIEFRQTSGYNDYAFGIMLRYLFIPTLRCLSPELPSFLLNRMY